ncbi:serine hydrolase domain-containing protein [Polaribacter sp. Hel1_85]|uniref:serine hydrolase domain-containing protein n=1 Tax=Polaribacter sp. Hel1_85 TaxID=1250005 RepID=UPI00052E0C64|nr:serine hydrolase [Polaribacter sp. Hel1_85]KGL63111.1 beta-lactamase [Polaribacter sp. Hel1_85]
MNATKTYSFLLLFLFTFSFCSKKEVEEEQTAETYFPSLTTDTWETILPEDLNWNLNKIEELKTYLSEKNTKSFMVLYNGKIVLEEYFNNHTSTNNWYWASAGKTLTATIFGIAQDENLLNINDKVSDFLGIGWTSTTLEQENQITCKNLLSMTSGLDDTLGDAVFADNLKYVANAGTRWAYHNVYVKMQDVVANASNITWQNYFNTKLSDKIGMNGTWTDLGSLSVYWSNTRSMARFGLLIFANGKWENTQIVSESFLMEATNTSQNINNSYGYLWWLNGKPNYHLPQTQVQFNGELIPNAPADMYAALGKNDQKIYVVPSKKLVIIRMGESAEDSNFALSNFDNDLWEKINAVIE